MQEKSQQQTHKPGASGDAQHDPAMARQIIVQRRQRREAHILGLAFRVAAASAARAAR